MSDDEKTRTAAPCRGSLSLTSPMLEDFVARLAGQPVALAVSGGGDSMAMLHLLAGRLDLSVVSVDHGLRPEAAAEAEMVGQVAQSLGCSHTTLRWQPPSGGNLMDQARRARIDLMGDWARAQGIGHIAMAHTADDELETFIMRLARASGLQGLSGMRHSWQEAGVLWHRPMLDLRREALRDYLRGQGARWADDPSNDNPKYERVRIRQAAPQLAALGLTPEVIGASVAHLARAEEALSQALGGMVARHVTVDRGDVLVSLEGLTGDLQGEFRRRLWAVILGWINGEDYAPRGPKLDAFCQDIDQTRTLAGVRRSFDGKFLRFTRELAAVPAPEKAADGRWDRWHLRPAQDGLDLRGLTIGPLGLAGLGDCPDWRETGLPRASLSASPAVWKGATLVAAPLAGWSNGWIAEIAAPFGPSMLFTR